MIRRLAGIALVVILACCLAPGLAFAADQSSNLSAAQVTAETMADTPTATPMATVYVVSSSKETNKKAKMSTTTQYTTNKNGLLTQEVIKQKGFGVVTKTWTYDAKNRVTKWQASDGSSSATKTITVAKNGLPKKDVQKTSSYGNWSPFSSTYKIKGRKVTSITRKYKGSGTMKYQLQYKGKKVVALKNLTYKNQTTYAYDKKGNLSKTVAMKGSTKVPIVNKNTYKSGRLTKRVSTVKSAHGSSTTTTFTYKKITVPKSMVNKVKAQQWAIINGNLNFALGSWPES